MESGIETMTFRIRWQGTAAAALLSTALLLTSAPAEAEPSQPVPAEDSLPVRAQVAAWESYSDKARDAVGRQDFESAETQLRAALRLARTFPQPDQKVVISLNNLAIVHSQRGQFALATPLLKEALQVTVKLNGENHANTAECLFNLAIVHLQIRKIDEAIAYAERGATITAKPDKGSLPYFAACLVQAAQILAQKGDSQRTEKVLLRSVEVTRKQFGAEHPRVAIALASLATLYRSQERFAAAEKILVESRRILEKQESVPHSALALVLNNLGTIYQAQGRLQKTEPLLRKSVQLIEIELGSKHPRVAAAKMNLAIVLDALDKRDEARVLLEDVLPVFRSRLGSGHAWTRECQQRLDQLVASLQKSAQPKASLLPPGLELLNDTAPESREPLAAFDVARKGRPLLVPVVIAGKSYSFLIDTGSEVTVFDHSLKSHLEPIDKSVQAVTAGGQRKVNLFVPPEFTFGALAVTVPDRVACTDLAQVKQVTGLSVAGILGMDVLQHLILQIDFDRGRLNVLSEVPELPGRSLEISFFHHRLPVVSVTLPDGESESFIIDSGLGISGTLKEATFDRLEAERLMSRKSTSFVATLAGSQETSSGFVSGIKLAGYEHTPARVNRTSYSMIGLGMLSRHVVTLDFPGRRMHLRRGLRFGVPDQQDLSGLHLLFRDGQIVVDSVDAGSQAERQGLRAGDQILTADNVPGSAEWLFTIRERLSKPSHEVVVVYRRDGRIETATLQLVGDAETNKVSAPRIATERTDSAVR